MILKLSPQNQITLPHVALEELGVQRPTHFRLRVHRGHFWLTPVVMTDFDRIAAGFEAHGLSREVRKEAMRIVECRKRGGT
jgi:hypothetical protein